MALRLFTLLPTSLLAIATHFFVEAPLRKLHLGGLLICFCAAFHHQKGRPKATAKAFVRPTAVYTIFLLRDLSSDGAATPESDTEANVLQMGTDHQLHRKHWSRALLAPWST